MSVCPDCPYGDGSSGCPLGAKCDLVNIALTDSKEEFDKACVAVPHLGDFVPELLNKPKVETGVLQQ